MKFGLLLLACGALFAQDLEVTLLQGANRIKSRVQLGTGLSLSPDTANYKVQTLNPATASNTTAGQLGYVDYGRFEAVTGPIPTGASLPVSAGTPTLAQAQAIVARIAQTVSRNIYERSTVAKYIYSQATSGITLNGSGTTSVGGRTVTINTQKSYSENASLTIVSSNLALADDFSLRAAGQLSQQIDSTLLGLYFNFTTNTPVGTGGSALADASINSAISTLKGNSEPVLVFMHSSIANTYGFAQSFSLGGWSFLRPTLYGVNATGNQTVGQAPSASSSPTAWIIPSPFVPSTGSGPVTRHNFACLPSTLRLVTAVQPNTNDATHAEATSTYKGITVRVSITNSGSGGQDIYVIVAYGVDYINATGVVVRS